MHTILKKYFPFRTKSISCRRLEAPWITSGILKCIKRKHRWYRMAKSNLISVDSYKKCCKALKNLLKLAKSEYYLHKFTSLGNNPKKNWNVLNKLLNKTPRSTSCKFNINGKNVDKPQEIASHFNEFFVNHPISIQNNIQPPNNNYLHLIKPPLTSMFFEPITDLEVAGEIKRLKKSGGIHDIPAKFLKLSCMYLSKLLCKLFNKCFISGIYPQIFKLARITPVYKKGTRNLISNYRPINGLCNLSKLFESLLVKRLGTYFNSGGLLAANQFGFRKQKNTELAVFSLIERALPAIENKTFTICIFLDYSACFDTISRNILLDKLSAYYRM